MTLLMDGFTSWNRLTGCCLSDSLRVRESTRLRSLPTTKTALHHQLRRSRRLSIMDSIHDPAQISFDETSPPSTKRSRSSPWNGYKMEQEGSCERLATLSLQQSIHQGYFGDFLRRTSPHDALSAPSYPQSLRRPASNVTR